MNYEILMKDCLDLAKCGTGFVSPNPLVGAIVLDKTNCIISKGYHQKYGQNHAERNALIDLPTEITEGGTLVVNLEPCSHFGKTPPCTDLIIEKKIKQVVIGMRDVNPIVSGNGINKLLSASIEVVEGVLENECKKLNEIYVKNMTVHKSYVAIKVAATLDGKIATYNGSSKWITSENARKEVINIRERYDAILTSSSTVIVDNPNMRHRNKVILDRELRTDFKNAKIYKTGNCYVFYDKNLSPNKISAISNIIKSRRNILLLPTDAYLNKIDLEAVLLKLYDLGIMSVLIESGGKLCGSFLKYADKIYQFIAPKILGDNRALSCYDYRSATNISDADNFFIDSINNYSPDILMTLYPIL